MKKIFLLFTIFVSILITNYKAYADVILMEEISTEEKVCLEGKWRFMSEKNTKDAMMSIYYSEKEDLTYVTINTQGKYYFESLDESVKFRFDVSLQIKNDTTIIGNEIRKVYHYCDVSELYSETRSYKNELIVGGYIIFSFVVMGIIIMCISKKQSKKQKKEE